MDKTIDLEKYGHLPEYGSKDVKNFLAMIQTCRSNVAVDELALQEMNKKQNDFLHDIEIPNDDEFTKDSLAEFATNLRTFRRSRRVVKDELIVSNAINRIYDYIPDIESKLLQLIKDIEKEETYILNRKYVPKVSLPSIDSIESPEYKPDTTDHHECQLSYRQMSYTGDSNLLSFENTTTANNEITEYNRALLTEENTLIMVVNKILSRWGGNNNEAIYEGSEGIIPDGLIYTFHFQLNNTPYDFSGAKSTLLNFTEALKIHMKEINSSTNIDIKTTISDRLIKIKRKFDLTSRYEVYIDNKLRYIIKGSIVFFKIKKRTKKK